MLIYRVFLAYLLSAIVLTGVSFAEDVLLDSVAAIVNDTAITYSEFEKKYEEAQIFSNAAKIPMLSKTDVISTMTNRVLLKSMAIAMKLSGKDDDELIAKFVDIKVRSYAIVREEDIERFCTENKVKAESDEERKKIEKYLTEEDVNKRLKALIEELRSKSYIKIYVK
ncbi:hypothetical protein [Candidatus Magnetomonas plexicatena]|uniref:hypothetical protein n=1 Tax=Candidatus Magnetomonas plexicatena TaxID=2552947 RepID=UPI001C769EE9|nr:hypothetical protein E2O03_009025 [Nitrospirales bacterium LBB_01]